MLLNQQEQSQIIFHRACVCMDPDYMNIVHTISQLYLYFLYNVCNFNFIVLISF